LEQKHNKSSTKANKSDRKQKREEFLKTFQLILDVPKTFHPFQKGRSVANDLKFVVKLFDGIGSRCLNLC
jgi:hypothetical protein